MANRYFNQFRLSLEKSVVDLFANVTFGGTGAPTLVAANSKGVASIVRDNTGLYTITLSDSYVGLLMVDYVLVKNSATGPAAYEMYVVSQAVGTVAAPTIVVQFAAATTATDPGSGDAVLLQFSLRNSTAY